MQCCSNDVSGVFFSDQNLIRFTGKLLLFRKYNKMHSIAIASCKSSFNSRQLEICRSVKLKLTLKLKMKQTLKIETKVNKLAST